MLGVVVWTLYDAREAARRAAEQETGNIALALEGDIGRVIDTLDLSLRSAVRGMATPGLADMPPEVRQASLFNSAMEAEDFLGIFIVDDAGGVIYRSASPGQQPVDIGDRAFFQSLRTHAEPGLLISGPLISRIDGQSSLALTRRIDRPDGSLAGFAVAVLRVNYFEALFRPLNLGKLGIVAIFNTNAQLIARRPNIERSAEPNARLRDLSRRLVQSSGTYEGASPVDGVQRLYSYRHIGNLPLIISVGFATADIYAEWVQKTAVLASALLLLLIVGASLAWSLWRQSERRARAERAAIDLARDYAMALAPLKTLFANSADSMLIARVHANGDISYEATNPVWERLTGVPAANAIGRTPEACLPPQLAADTLVDWRESLRLGRAHRVTFRSEPPGIERDWEAVIVPVQDEQGEIQGLVSIGRDMTERNMLEANLRQAHRAEAVGQLTAGIAHDFNNLLQAITAALDVLVDQPGLDQEGRECAAVAGDAAQRGAALVHRLLAFSRKQTLNPSLLQPEQVLADIAPLISRVLGPRIRVETLIDEDAWPVCADGGQLGDCLLNLALNARDAMPGGGVVRLRVDDAGPDAARAAGLPAEDYTLFSVEDEGAGMSSETMARALEPFFTTKPIGEGTGLGLSMVQGFARQSGGDVRIESTVGRGSTVSLWLPRAAARGAISAERRRALDHWHRRVLLVDDEKAVRQMLTLFLAKAGFGPLAVASGDEALGLLQAGEPCDLLVTDQSMPGLTGSELIREAASLRPGLPTMLITGYDRVNGLDELLGRVTVLRKPFGRIAFIRQVQALLSSTPDAPADGPGAGDRAGVDWSPMSPVK